MSDTADTKPTKSRRRAGRAITIGFGIVAAIALLVLFATPQGKDFRNLWSNGTIQAMLFPAAKRTYSASDQKNLEAICQGLMLYEDSEGQFPKANGWMDAIENRIKVSDMNGNESNKKLVRPDLSGKPGEYGFAINDKAAGKYKDDAGAKTILVYESKQTVRNAHGDPARDRDGMAINVDGTIVK
jgi:hypothetical protein